MRADESHSQQHEAEPGARVRRRRAPPRPALAAFTLEAAYGSVKPVVGPHDIEQAIRDAKDEKAARTAAGVQRVEP